MLSPWSDRCFRIRRIAQLVDHFGGKQEGELCDDYWSERTIAYTMIQEFKAILVCTWSERFFVKIIECHLLTYMFHMLALLLYNKSSYLNDANIQINVLNQTIWNMYTPFSCLCWRRMQWSNVIKSDNKRTCTNREQAFYTQLHVSTI